LFWNSLPSGGDYLQEAGECLMTPFHHKRGRRESHTDRLRWFALERVFRSEWPTIPGEGGIPLAYRAAAAD
jgi:hypothetical protein